MYNFRDYVPGSVRRFLAVLRPRRSLPYTAEVGTAGVRAKFRITVNVERFRVGDLGDEAEFLERTIPLLRKDDVVWDIGSNVGVNALLYAGVGARVLAFEPDPQIFEKLQENIVLNPGRDVVALNVALSDTEGKLEMASEGLGGRSPRLGADSPTPIVVQARKGDAVLADGAPAPTVLKIDVEGAEGRVLSGLSQTLRAGTVRLCFVEIHPAWLPAFGDSTETVRESLRAAGLRPTWSNDRGHQRHEIWSK